MYKILKQPVILTLNYKCNRKMEYKRLKFNCIKLHL